jgi:hypothetical protein
MNVRDAIGGVGPGPVTKFPDPPPNPGDKARQWSEALKNLRGGRPDEELEPSKTKGEELKPGLAPREEVRPVSHEELHRIS